MAAKKKAAAAAETAAPRSKVGEQEREAWIATAAYYLAEARNFEPGYETSDWLEAERAFTTLAQQS